MEGERRLNKEPFDLLNEAWAWRAAGECLKGLEAGEGGGTPDDPSLPLLHDLQPALL